MRLTGARLLVALLPLAVVAACGRGSPAPSPMPIATPAPVPEPPKRMSFEATAYSIEGRTAAGTRAREGIVAADPAILPLGTRIRVHEAGPYSGTYVVEDTGRAVKGREIDVYIANDAAAKRFGRKLVEVEVLERGRGRRTTSR